MREGRSRGYGQFCGLARALDVVGDRWTLLIVRELLAGPRRFGELEEGLCGVATNLLTQRLRRLEDDGVVQRRLGKPGAGTMYALTPWGEALRPVVNALLRWSGPLMAKGQGDDAFRPHWLEIALSALLPQSVQEQAVIGLQTQGTKLVLEAGPAGIRVRPDGSVERDGGQHTDQRHDADLAATPEVILGLAEGALDLAAAVAHGAEVHGSRPTLARVFGAGADVGSQR